MTPSERIKIIQAVAEKLSGEEWSVLDLTLQQFGLPWSASWPGSDRKAYLIEMVGNAADDSLLALAGHVGLGPQVVSSRAASFWQPGHFRLFLSHLASYKVETSALRDHLAKWNISGFVAHEDIEPTLEWQAEIEKALFSMDALLALLTPGFHESKWTDHELGICVGRGLLALPVRLGVDPYGFIGKRQAISGLNLNAEQLAEQTFHILRKHDLTRRQMAEALVFRFATSISFAAAKANMTYLEELPAIEASLLPTIAKSVEANDQVSFAWGVPDRVNAFLKKHGYEGVA